MLLEIVLLARLTPFLGGPVPAAGVVLTTLLLFAGLGSRSSERFAARPRTLVAVTLASAAGILLLSGLTSALPIAPPASPAAG